MRLAKENQRNQWLNVQAKLGEDLLDAPTVNGGIQVIVSHDMTYCPMLKGITKKPQLGHAKARATPFAKAKGSLSNRDLLEGANALGCNPLVRADVRSMDAFHILPVPGLRARNRQCRL